MREYTVKEYDKDDYDRQELEVNSMSKSELAGEVDSIMFGHLGDYNFTGKEWDFELHRKHMVLYRVIRILLEKD